MNIAKAIAEFLAKHRSRRVTERLDAVYATESSALDLVVQNAQAKTILRDKW